MLIFEGVSAHIQGAQVLRDVTFQFPDSATVTIFGRNGAGKTTLLRTLMGLLTPSAGKIYLGEDELTGVEPYLRPGFGIGYAPEDRRLFSAFTVEQNLELPVRVAGLPREELKRRLERVYDILPELREMRSRSAGSVSGGQGKIVALGRALMIGTSLVLLDEPFQGLAPALAHRYADVLRKVRDKNPETTLVVTESSPDLLRGFGDLVCQIERGELNVVNRKETP